MKDSNCQLWTENQKQVKSQNNENGFNKMLSSSCPDRLGKGSKQFNNPTVYHRICLVCQASFTKLCYFQQKFIIVWLLYIHLVRYLPVLLYAVLSVSCFFLPNLLNFFTLPPNLLIQDNYYYYYNSSQSL